MAVIMLSNKSYLREYQLISKNNNATLGLYRGVLSPLLCFLIKSYHPTSIKRPVSLVSEINIQKATLCRGAKSAEFNLNRTLERGRAHSYDYLATAYSLDLNCEHLSPPQKTKTTMGLYRNAVCHFQGDLIQSYHTPSKKGTSP